MSANPGRAIAFLGKFERLLSEGQFVAAYKYARLIAIADLAVQFGSELELPFARSPNNSSNST